MKKKTALLIALLLVLQTFASCADAPQDETTGETTAKAASETIAEETESENPYYDGYVDPFVDTDLGGETLTIYNSVNERGTLTSSNYLIEGPEEITGDAAPDSAYQRNLDVMEKLNVNLAYENCNYAYDQVALNIRKLLQSGDSAYDIVINDIYGLAPLTPEGLFHNINDGKNFDFDNPWWYDDFMSDISIISDMRFILAGDYFIDMLRCSHCLIMNKGMYRDIYGDPEDVYSSVLNKTWTLDSFRTLIDGAAKDLDGNGTMTKDDQFGFAIFEYWGPMIPWLISADPGFIERDENGCPIITLNNERSVMLTEKLNGIFNNTASAVNLTGGNEAQTENIFFEGRSLFLGYQRLGSLENTTVRDTDVDLAILPYPMLDETQKDYVTSTHDTAELGFIPVSVPMSRLDFISTVIEVLCRETYAQVLPNYYESSLKVKYTRDQSSAQMLDIIHDHFGNGFALAYSNALGGYFLNTTFNDAISKNSTDFVSRAKTKEKLVQKLLNKMVKNTEDLRQS